MWRDPVTVHPPHIRPIERFNTTQLYRIPLISFIYTINQSLQNECNATSQTFQLNQLADQSVAIWAASWLRDAQTVL